MGPDGLEAEVLAAGGEQIIVAVSAILESAGRLMHAPVKWRGGRIISCYKSKGDIEITANSRGLLLSDHLAKTLTGALQGMVDDGYTSFIPDE